MELVDTRGVAVDPLTGGRHYILITQAAEEIDPQLLEIPLEASDQHPLPRIGRDIARNLLLSPVEPKDLADVRIGFGQLKLVDLLSRRQSGKQLFLSKFIGRRCQADRQPQDLSAYNPQRMHKGA